MFVAAQYLFLKSSLFKNLMRAYSPCISEISLSVKRIRAVDQKHNYQLEWPNSFFIHKNRLRNCDTGWVLCLISMAFISILYKPQKGTPTMVTPSTSNFQFIPSRSIPFGRDRPLTFFTRIIGHNPQMLIGFLPKLVLRSALMGPLSAPTFSPIGESIRVLWRICKVCEKKR